MKCDELAKQCERQLEESRVQIAAAKEQAEQQKAAVETLQTEHRAAINYMKLRENQICVCRYHFYELDRLI